jgi:phospholipase D-like protein
MVVADFGSGQVFWSMLYFTLFFVWIWMMVAIFGDIVRSRDLSGWAKALWTVAIVLLPLIGAFAYLVIRGSAMTEHALRDAERDQELFRARTWEGTRPSHGDELATLESLRAQGLIDEDEFVRITHRVSIA